MQIEELVGHIKLFLKTRFSIRKDKADEENIIESIQKGIEFRGTNVWILVFAIFLASIGLNVNSTAIIIGAMLISPLMGPIMGVGLGLGIFDFEMVKLAAKNLAIMVSISLIASTIYFWLSPLSEAQSELLSRTAPTIWDVLIALFGGLAGIIAGSSKEKGNILPGVAIATALMPPLCTAGFGIARGDFYFFIGAFYLFCINAVFISVSTFVVVRILKFSKITFVDKRVQKKMRNAITTIVLITIIPSIIIAYLTVKKALFEQRAKAFIQNEFRFDKTIILTKRIDYENSRIDLVMLGIKVPEDTLEHRRAKINSYDLSGVQLNITQGINDTSTVDINEMKSGILQEVYSQSEKIRDERDKIIFGLQNELIGYKNQTLPVNDILQEMKIINGNVLSLSLSKNIFYNTQLKNSDTLTTAIIDFSKRPGLKEIKTIENWLKIRTKSDTLKLIIE